MQPHRTPSRRARLAIALVAGCIAVALQLSLSAGGLAADFDPLWCAAREMLRGKDPYSVVGPAATCRWPWGLVYPITTMFVLAPVALLPLSVARLAWVFLAGAAFAYAITKDSIARLPLLASAPFLSAIERGQWSPLLVAAMTFPILGPILSAKPTVGAALWLSRPGRTAIVGGVFLAVMGFLVLPTWPSEWLAGTSTAQFRMPIMSTGGVLLLLALAKWRRPDGRLLAALSVTPHSTFVYEALYPLTVASTTRQALTLSALSWLAWLTPYVVAPRQGYGVWLRVSGAANVLLVYLPALALVLRRPNEGPLPAWLEARVSLLPRWLRGASELAK